MLSKEICTEFGGSNDQLVDVSTKSLREPRIEFICSKLGTYNLYAQAWAGEVLNIGSLVVVLENCYMLYLWAIYLLTLIT